MRLLGKPVSFVQPGDKELRSETAEFPVRVLGFMGFRGLGLRVWGLCGL